VSCLRGALCREWWWDVGSELGQSVTLVLVVAWYIG